MQIADSGFITDELDATIVKVATALADELQVHPSQLGNMPADWDMKADVEQYLAKVLDKSAQRLLFVGYVGQIKGEWGLARSHRRRWHAHWWSLGHVCLLNLHVCRHDTSVHWQCDYQHATARPAKPHHKVTAHSHV